MAVHEVFPYLTVSDAASAIAFYVEAFGGTEKLRLVDPGDGRIGHAEVAFEGGGTIMLSDAYPEIGRQAPTEGPASSVVHLHVDDCDAFMARAEAAGAVVERPPTDQFYGERSGALRDPFGHRWLIGSEIEKVAPDEMQRRWDAMAEGSAS